MWPRRPSVHHLAPAAREIVWAATDAIADREIFARRTIAMPARFHRVVAEKYAQSQREQGYREANTWLRDLSEAFTGSRLELSASDSDIADYAERRARAISVMLGDQEAAIAEGVRTRLEKYARAHGVRAPQAKTLTGVVARMTSAAWWRRALRREIVRRIEEHAIRLGLVHRRASIFASEEAIARRAEQKRRNARYLESTVAQNSSGQEFTLADLASKNVSNPRIRRTELMVRMRGFEEFAEKAGHVPMFYTWTCPSRMHAVIAETCLPNPKYDGTSPRAAQDYLVRQWAKCRAALDRRQVFPYGVRVSEPHHDGTPHWHILLFMPRALEPFVTRTMEFYAKRVDREELNTERANTARFKAIEIDRAKGSAAGYVAKYIAKNVDGFNIDEDFESEGAGASSTIRHVDAWASTHKIRQFQQIGSVPVTVWRELRRLREAPQLPLFDPFWESAESHTWREFTRLMGGNAIRRRDRPLQLWRVHHDQVTSYGEDAPPKVEGVRHIFIEHCRTRFEEWGIKHAKDDLGQMERRRDCLSMDAQLQRFGAVRAGGSGEVFFEWRSFISGVGLCEPKERCGRERSSGTSHTTAEGTAGTTTDRASYAYRSGLGRENSQGRAGIGFERYGQVSSASRLAPSAVSSGQLSRHRPMGVAAAEGRGGFGFPWTCVNNCTQVEDSTTCEVDVDWIKAYERESRGPP